MYSTFAFFGILFVTIVIDIVLDKPIIAPVKAFVANNYPRSYGGLFGWPLVVAAAIYALALLASPIFGLQATLDDVSTMFVLGFFLGLVTCFFSTVKDVGAHAKRLATGSYGRFSQPFEKISSLLFLACVYGSMGAIFFGSTSTMNIFHH